MKIEDIKKLTDLSLDLCMEIRDIRNGVEPSEVRDQILEILDNIRKIVE